MTEYRVAVKCLECNKEYITRKLSKKKLPEKCKECGSIKVAENPKMEKNYFEDWSNQDD